MPPAARKGDNHICPKVDPPPHVGGPILEGASTVKIAGQQAARVGDPAKCNGPPDTIADGSSSVLICGQPAAREGDPTDHGGLIVQGASSVHIGDFGKGHCECMKAAAAGAKGVVSAAGAGKIGAD